MVGEVKCSKRLQRGRKYLHMFQTRCFLISSTVQFCAKKAPMLSATAALLNTCDVRNMILKKVWALGWLRTLRTQSSHACTKGPAQYPFSFHFPRAASSLSIPHASLPQDLQRAHLSEAMAESTPKKINGAHQTQIWSQNNKLTFKFKQNKKTS